MTGDDATAVPKQTAPCRERGGMPGSYGAMSCRRFLLINMCLWLIAVADIDVVEGARYQKCCIL